MRRNYANRLFQVCARSGIPVDRFSHEETQVTSQGQPYLAFVIRVASSPLHFQVVQSEQSYDGFWYRHTTFVPKFALSPWMPKRPNGLGTDTVTITEIERYLGQWIATHARPFIEDESIVDLWVYAGIFGTTFLDGAFSEQDATPFTYDEKIQIKQALREFRWSLIEEFHPTQQQKEAIDLKLDYLMAAVDRLNKIDWKALLFTTAIAIAINLTVDTQGGRQLLNLLKQVIMVAPKLLQGG